VLIDAGIPDGGATDCCACPQAVVKRIEPQVTQHLSIVGG
jgi:hypothetical protein